MRDAILRGDFVFHDAYWTHISDEAKDVSMALKEEMKETKMKEREMKERDDRKAFKRKLWNDNER